MKAYERHQQSGKGGDVTAARNEAMAGFIQASEGLAHGIAYRLTGDAEAAKEIVHESLYRAMKRWAGFDPTRPLEPWILGFIRNIALDWWRTYERRCVTSLDLPVGGAEDGRWAEILPDGSATPLEHYERMATTRTVREAVAGLSSHLKKALVLRDLEGQSYREISRRLRVPLGTIRSRISRARKVLRGRLAEFRTLD